MAFVRLPGITGKVYVPEGNLRLPRKHPCKNCYRCQFCGDDRCSICLAQSDGPKKSRRRAPR